MLISNNLFNLVSQSDGVDDTSSDCSLFKVTARKFRSHSLPRNMLGLSNINSDIITFSGKNYNIRDIKNCTNHCGYCGCKLYNENQMESIAKELLNSKSTRLQGKIKSILEKLEGAKNSDEIAIAKRLENSQEIEFFKDFLAASKEKSFLKGEFILEQLYKTSYEESFKLLMKNMHPLLKTIDHISPQKLNEKNNNIDLNLIEACYCCNHNIKKGINFSEFYAMFPSIQNNMPQEKLEFALSHALTNGQNGIENHISANNILKSLNNLVTQRNEILNTLKTIDYRITKLKEQIIDNIENIHNEINQKKSNLSNLQKLLDELYKDPDYISLREIYQLQNSLDNIVNAIKTLNEKNKNIAFSLSKIKKQEKSEQKIQQLKKLQEKNSENIKQKEEEKIEIENKIEQLSRNLKNIQAKKQKFESIINEINSLNADILILVQTEKELKDYIKI